MGQISGLFFNDILSDLGSPESLEDNVVLGQFLSLPWNVAADFSADQILDSVSRTQVRGIERWGP